ncbi:hypothetical protein ACROYT_G011360 [Oculina patagonica]
MYNMSEDSVQCDSHQETTKSRSSSSSTVDSCVDLLKYQASKASCPLDLLAAESLGTRLVSICSPSEQLLSKNQLESVLCVVKVIKHMLSEQCFNRVYFTKYLTSKGPHLPLEVVWMLHKSCVVSFNTYLACCLQHSETVDMVSSGIISLCSCITVKEKQENILSDLLGRLVTFSFLENKAKEGSNNKLEKVSQEILDNVVEKTDFLACMKMKEFSSKKDNSNSCCVLEIIRRLKDIPWTAIKRFFSRQLNRLFTMQSELEDPEYYQAFCNQTKLKFSALSETTRTVLEQFLLVFDPLSVMGSLKNAFLKDKACVCVYLIINFEGVLAFISVFVVLVKEAASMLEGYVNDLVNESLNNNDSRSLSVAFLVIRQVSLQGGHVFQPYVTWFQSMFGNQGSTKLNNKKSVQLFVKFLSDLVPYEPAEYLKVHVIKAPQVPSKLRELVTDYVSLAKTRLMDLKEPVELMGMYGDSSVTSGMEAKSEHAKQLEQASADVEKVLTSYEKTGKVPSTVMEASIFRKPYFIGRFLPALLTPRKVPDEPDVRAELIDVLSKAGKIPKNMLSAYQSACEKITIEQIEVSSSDDEGTLSGMEKLVKCLDKLTKLILESLKANGTSKQSGRISSQLSIISATIQSITKSWNETQLPNQLVEIDVGNLEKTSTEPVADAILDAFCQTCAAVNSCMSESLVHLKRYHWVRDFVAMVTSVTPLHKNLYFQLWRKICKEGSSTKKEDIYGLAVFLCCLCASNSTMLPILLTGIKRPAEKHLPEVFTICSYVDALCEHIPICTSQWMEFFLRFSCSYVEHALEVFYTNVTELKGNVAGHTAYLSPVMLTKMFYLFHRLNIREESGFYKPSLPTDVDCMFKNLVSLPQFQQLQEKEQQLSFSEWCRWELSISAREDFLPDTDRRIYHQYRVLDHYLPLGSLEGGCDGCASKACSVIFHTLLDSGSRCAQQQNDLDVSKNDMINLLQDLIPMLSQDSTDETNSHQSGETWSGSWLLEQLHSRLKQIQSNAGEDKSKRLQNYDFLLATEVASFMKLAMRLPPYLLFADHQDFIPDLQSITPVVHFINDYLRPYMSDNCCLPFDVTLYILKALLTHTRRPPHESRTPSNSKLLSEFMKDCSLFCASVQNYWKQLKPLAANLGDVTLKALNQAELLLNWKNRVDKSQAVSLRELENIDVSLVASFIAVNLHTMSRNPKVATGGRQHDHIEFLKRVAVVTLTEVIRVVADGMGDVDFSVNLVYQEISTVTDQSHFTSTPFTEARSSMFSQADTPFGSLYLPSDTESLDDTCQDRTPVDRSRSALNDFLASRDISPIRSSLRTTWDDVGERTKRYYVKKASEAVAASLEVIAGEDSDKLWDKLVSSKAMNQHFPSTSLETEKVDSVLLESLAECYNSATQWDTRRQILSIMVDKISFKSLQRWIPNLTQY